MIRLSIAAAALALLAATNPGAAQDYGYGYNRPSYNSYERPSYGYSRYGYSSYRKPSYSYERPTYNSYERPTYNSYERPTYGYGYSRYGYQGYSHPSDFAVGTPYYGNR